MESAGQTLAGSHELVLALCWLVESYADGIWFAHSQHAHGAAVGYD